MLSVAIVGLERTKPPVHNAPGNEAPSLSMSSRIQGLNHGLFLDIVGLTRGW